MQIILTGPAYPMRGGIAHFNTLLYKKLEEVGHSLKILSFSRQYPGFLFPGKTQFEEGDPLYPTENYPMLDSINPFSWIRSALWLKKQHPDLLIIQFWQPFFAPCFATLAMIAKRCRIKTIMICHNIIPHEKRLVDKLLARIGLFYINDYVVQSDSVLKDLLTFKSKVNYKRVNHPVYEIFPPAISQEEAKKNLNIQEKKVIAYFGLIRTYKGLKYLVKAMPDILKKEDIRFLICGEFYDDKEEILDDIESNNLNDHISLFDHFIPNEEVHHYFCAADIMVLPYISATQSGIIQIAYHYNKPVIATNVGGLPEVVLHEKTGYIVPPEDSQAISNAVLQYYNEKPDKEFQKNIKLEKEKYSWEYMVNAIESLYKESIQES